jgi:hypothetical protein
VLEGARTLALGGAMLTSVARYTDSKRVVFLGVSSACAVLSEALVPVVAATTNLSRVVTLGVGATSAAVGDASVPVLARTTSLDGAVTRRVIPKTTVQHKALGTVRAGADLAGVVTFRVGTVHAVDNETA